MCLTGESRINSPLPSTPLERWGFTNTAPNPVCPWPPSASTNGQRWRRAAGWFLSQREFFGKQRNPNDPKIKKCTVMNSILKAGTLQLFNDFHEYPGGPWINCQVLFRPFLKVTIQTTIKKRPERPCSILDAKPHFLPKKMTIPLKAVDPNAINQRQLCH